MKNNKTKKPSSSSYDDFEMTKPKKKLQKEPEKINLKSKKFWKERYEDEGEDLERFIRWFDHARAIICWLKQNLFIPPYL